MYTLSDISPQMSTTLSVRIDTDTKKRLEALAKRARRSKSFLAAEAIAAFVEAESWQLDEIQAGLKQLDEGSGVAHQDVAKWLRSWGRKRERKALSSVSPRCPILADLAESPVLGNWWSLAHHT